MKQFIYAVVAVIVIAVAFNLFNPAVNTVEDLPFISVDKTFDRSDDDYVVYFYQDDCSHCKEFEPHLIESVSTYNTPAYIVDMKESENTVAWYDWEAHSEKYDKVIGKVIDDKEVLNDGESHDDYPASEGWSIGRDGDDLVATYNMAMNNKNPQSASELEIAGTPTLIRVKDGKVVAYGEGIVENTAILDEMVK